jgi:hypothetical protein
MGDRHLACASCGVDEQDVIEHTAIAAAAAEEQGG